MKPGLSPWPIYLNVLRSNVQESSILKAAIYRHSFIGRPDELMGEVSLSVRDIFAGNRDLVGAYCFLLCLCSY